MSPGKHLLLAAAIFLYDMPTTLARTLRYGTSYVEQGDYLLQPGVQIAFHEVDEQRFRLDFYGRRFGAFFEATAILGWDHTLPVFPWPELVMFYGVSFMDEYTAVERPSGRNDQIHSLNLGINLGLSWTIVEHEAFDLRAEWNSHLFAAGLAFIVLTTARKSIFTLSLGYEL